MDTNVLPQVEFALEALAYIESQLDSRIKDFDSSRRFHRKQLLRITILFGPYVPRAKTCYNRKLWFSLLAKM